MKTSRLTGLLEATFVLIGLTVLLLDKSTIRLVSQLQATQPLGQASRFLSLLALAAPVVTYWKRFGFIAAFAACEVLVFLAAFVALPEGMRETPRAHSIYVFFLVQGFAYCVLVRRIRMWILSPPALPKNPLKSPSVAASVRSMSAMSDLPWLLISTLLLELSALTTFVFWFLHTDWLFGHTKGRPELLIASLCCGAAGLACAVALFLTSKLGDEGLRRRAFSYLLAIPCAGIAWNGFRELPKTLDRLYLNDTARLARMGPSAVPKLTRRLDDTNAYVRSYAAGGIRKAAAPAPDAVPRLVQMMSNPKEFVNARMEAMLALGTMKTSDPNAIAALIEMLNDDQFHLFAAQSLEMIGKPAEPALRAALADSRPLVRTSAAEVLNRKGGQRAEAISVSARDLTPYLVALASGDSIKGERAAESLGSMGAAAAPAVPALAAVLTNTAANSSVRFAASEALNAIGPAAVDAVPAMVVALGDPDSAVRSWALDVLFHLGHAASSATPALIVAIHHADPSTRLRAVVTAVDVGTDAPQLVPAFMEFVHDNDPKMREAALNGVSRHLKNLEVSARTTALRALCEATKDPKIDVRRTAEGGLDTNVKDLPLVMSEVLKIAEEPNRGSWDPVESSLTKYVEWRHNKILVGPMPTELIGHFEATLKHPEIWHRRNAASMLAYLGPEARQSQAALIKASKDPDAEIAASAARALKLIEDGTRFGK